jgi:curved DNA-binding protein CbpA
MFMIDLGAESLYSKIGLSPNATNAEIRTARDNLIQKLVEEGRQTTDPEMKKSNEDRQKEINSAGDRLAAPEDRKKYDAENAHLKFFLPQVAAAPLFAEKSDRMIVLHRSIREFLVSKGEVLSPLSDVERFDFSSDETPIGLLDSLLSPSGGNIEPKPRSRSRKRQQG